VTNGQTLPLKYPRNIIIILPLRSTFPVVGRHVEINSHEEAMKKTTVLFILFILSSGYNVTGVNAGQVSGLANGIYYYEIIATGADEASANSKSGTLVVVKK
jgi:hypothetical protein